MRRYEGRRTKEKGGVKWVLLRRLRERQWRAEGAGVRYVTPARMQLPLYWIVWARWCHLSAISGVTSLLILSLSRSLDQFRSSTAALSNLT